jgi:NADPH-dependent ferric siderophore reductase
MVPTDAPVQSEPAGDALEAYLRENGTDVLNRINIDFEDSVLLIGRSLTARKHAREVTVTAIDRLGLDAVVVDAEGEHRERIEFDDPIDDPLQITAALFALMMRARDADPSGEATSAERAMAEVAAIRTFLTTVESVSEVHPHLRRITFSGGDLVDFEPGGVDSFVYVLAPPPGCDHLAIDQSFTWEQHASMPEDIRPIGAYYTVRRWHPDAKRLEALFVLHGDEGQASAWAARAKPGDPVALWGPRTGYEPPAATDQLLLIADDTGLPAVAAILDQMPDGVTATVIAEVSGPAEQQELRDAANIDVRWLYRGAAEAGTTKLLIEAVRALPVPTATTYVWGAGESRTMTAIRKYLRKELGFPREAISLVAYWRHAHSPL